LSYSELVEIGKVFPSPLGGSVFKGMAVGSKSFISFRCSNRVLMDPPGTGEYWKIEGKQFYDYKHGNTVDVQSAFLRNIPSSIVVGRLLCNHPAFRGFGLGKAKIAKIIKELGEFSLVDLLNKNNYMALSAVINERIAKKLCTVWLTLKEETEIATFLVDNGFDSKLASRVRRLCKYNTIDRIQKNPYSLISLFDTKLSMFLLVDAVAKKLGFSGDHQYRKAGIAEFMLYKRLEAGHTIVELSELSKGIRSLKVDNMTDSLDCIKEALKQKVACVYEEDKTIYIQAIGVAFIERDLESRFKRLLLNPQQQYLFTENKPIEGVVGTYSEEYVVEKGFELTETQQNAIVTSLTNRLSILTGYAGTGKTAVIKGIVDVAVILERAVYVCALAGKAKERARQVIGREAFTIHKLISELEKKSSKVVNKYSDPLIIIDESSMVDASLMLQLMRAMRDNMFSILLIGDTAQLPPVGLGIFWPELVKSKKLPSVHLTQVHRQATESPINNAAMNIRNSTKHELQKWNGETEGVFLVDVDKSLAQNKLIDIFLNMNAKILTPFASAKFSLSTTKLNPLLQSAINKSRVKIQIGYTTIKEGDPVLVTINHHELGLFNGMTGVVTKIGLSGESQEEICVVEFDGVDKFKELTKIQCYKVGLQLAYALTVHKSQGSEYDNCIVVVDGEGIEKSMLYTAITRAKNLCLIVGSQDAYDKAILSSPRIDSLNYGFRW
jgi:exodeoxyribonuclease V alpha subunit